MLPTHKTISITVKWFLAWLTQFQYFLKTKLSFKEWRVPNGHLSVIVGSISAMRTRAAPCDVPQHQTGGLHPRKCLAASPSCQSNSACGTTNHWGKLETQRSCEMKGTCISIQMYEFQNYLMGLDVVPCSLRDKFLWYVFIYLSNYTASSQKTVILICITMTTSNPVQKF